MRKRWLNWVWARGDYWEPRVGFYGGIGKGQPPTWWTLWHRRWQPLWWRLDLACMSWYDCPAEIDPEGRKPITSAYTRRCMSRVGCA